MNGETNLSKLLKGMKPIHNFGEFVFCTTPDANRIPLDKTILFFREREGYTLVVAKDVADEFSLHYDFIASWITITVHSSREAVGLTAAFSKALSENSISCNVVAAFHHDHIFVPVRDTEKAMRVLGDLSRGS